MKVELQLQNRNLNSSNAVRADKATRVKNISIIATSAFAESFSSTLQLVPVKS